MDLFQDFANDFGITIIKYCDFFSVEKRHFYQLVELLRTLPSSDWPITLKEIILRAIQKTILQVLIKFTDHQFD